MIRQSEISLSTPSTASRPDRRKTLAFVVLLAGLILLAFFVYRAALPANMPGAVARTSTYALNNVTLPHALRIAKLGWKAALQENAHLSEGLNVHAGEVTYKAVADELGYDYRPVADLLG